MTDRFSICLPFTLAQECPHPENWSDIRNFSDDAHDPGGKTFCGLTQREYDLFRKQHEEVCQDVRLCTEDEGRELYMFSYWLPHCPVLPPGLDLQFFDASVNEGCLEAVRILQYVVGGLEVDGLWGLNTEGAVKAIKNIIVTIKAFTIRRKEVYRELKGFPYFGKDWLRRADEIGAQALKMVMS